MAYQVIARKFRPNDFTRVIGQEHITQTLARAIELGRIHHAYLFTGARGVGKTSTARILAKALNCEKGPTVKLCGQCQSCKEIAQGVSLDVREIDGASNTGVDDIRQLREDVAYMPTRGKYRIYIIDEVHMLSTSAFNALLKTLEEPPPHIVFIFATTEPHKILETILSRCQRYDFRLLTQSQILKQLKDISEAEKISIQLEALQLLAQESAGSMRDAETLLDQVISSAAGEITVEQMVASLGLVDRKTLWNALRFIVERNPQELLTLAGSLYEFGHDIKHFVQDLLVLLRHLNVAQIYQKSQAEELKDLLDLADSEMQILTELAPKISALESQRLYRLLADSFFEISRAENQRIALEMTFLRLVQTPPLKELSQLIDDVRALKSDLKSGARPLQTPTATPAATPSAHGAPAVKATSATVIQTSEPPAPAVTAEGHTLWELILEKFRNTKPFLASALEELMPVECHPKKIVLGVPKTSFAHDTVKDPENQKLIVEIVRQQTGVSPQIFIQIVQDLQASKTANQKRTEERKQLESELRDHPTVKNIRNIFGGDIEDVHTLNSKTDAT